MICPREVTVDEEVYPIVCDVCDKLLSAIDSEWRVNGRIVEGSEETEFYEDACPKCKTPLHLKRWHSIDYRDVDLYDDDDGVEGACAVCGVSMSEEDEDSIICKSCWDSKMSNPRPELTALVHSFLDLQGL